MKPEKRSFDVKNLEIRGEGKSLTLSGYAAVFDEPSVKMMGFREYVRKGAFTNSLKNDDIRSLWNHNPDNVLGRNISKTLRLAEDKKGLSIEVDLPDTQFARDKAESVRRGDVSQMSFAFRTIKDNWFQEDDEERRELLEVKLFEVSPVTFPAYPQTSISALRSMINFDELSAALSRVERAGVEAQGEDIQAIETAYTFISKIRGSARRQPQEPIEARHARIRRELSLLEAS